MKPSVTVVGVPLDLGQSRRGVDMGPSALRYAGLHERLRQIGCSSEDHGNLHVTERVRLPVVGGLAFLPAVVAACAELYEVGRAAVAASKVPLFVGGDHSISAGSVGGVSHDEPVGLLWIDAHGDFNTPATSPTGNIHGMPLAALLGLGAPELVDVGRRGPKLESRDVVLIGIRDLDPPEQVALRASGIRVYTMSEIDARGVAQVAREALQHLAHRSRLHISLDMDVLDPREAPGVGTPVTGGLTYREAHLLAEIIASDGRLGSVDVVEINPILDDRNRTAEIAVELVASLMGKAIL